MITYKLHQDRIYNDITKNIDYKLWSHVFPFTHTHTFYEIIFVLDGKFDNSLDGQVKTLNKYDVCLIKKENIHKLTKTSNQPVLFYNIMIKEEYFLKLATSICEDFFDNLEQYKTLNPQIFENILSIIEKAVFTPTTSLKEKQDLLQIAVTKLLCEFAIKNTKKDDSLVNKVIHQMSLHENMSLTIKDIADKVNFSVEHIIRLFKKNNLSTPNQIFTKIKLDYACELLVTTDYKTSYICELVGFCNVNYFNKVFKNSFCLSPQQYRKKYESYKMPIPTS